MSRKNPASVRLPASRPWWSVNTASTVSMRAGARCRRAAGRGGRGAVGRHGPLRRRVGGGDAAVDQQRLPGHERRLVGGEEQRAVGDLDRLAEATHRHVHEAALALGVVGQELGEQRREHRARAQRVGADPLAGVDHGDLAGHRQHRPLRRGVGDLRRRRAEVGHERGDVDDAAAARVEHRRDAVAAAPGDAGDVDVEDRRPRRRRSCWWVRRRRRVRCRRCCRARAVRRTSRRRGHGGGHAGVVARRRWRRTRPRRRRPRSRRQRRRRR